MSDFWTNKTVIVTGGAGFLGSHVVERLAAQHCRRIVVPRSRDYDLTRARERFGFSADTPFEAGLRKTMEWYESVRRDHPDGRGAEA